MSDDARDAGQADLLDAIDDGEGYYIECENGHGSLPPRHVCPDCGTPELAEAPLPDAGTIGTFSVIHATTPTFADDVPYVSAIADFGPVGLTGQVRGIAPESVETGTSVRPTIERTETTGDRVVVFRPR